MTRSLAATLALLAVLAFAASATGKDVAPVAPADAAPPAASATAPTVKAPLPFDHEEHAAILDKVGLACVDCHPVGLRSEATTEDGKTTPLPESLPIPRSICHGCHLAEVKGAPKSAAADCSSCHPVRAELLPEDHDFTWAEGHGREARRIQARCDDCHESGECIDCHEARGALTRSPHPAGFDSTHGIEARLDPNRCADCHAADACSTCHEGGGIPW